MRRKPDSPAAAPADPPSTADADLAGLNPPPESARALVAEPAAVPPPVTVFRTPAIKAASQIARDSASTCRRALINALFTARS